MTKEDRDAYATILAALVIACLFYWRITAGAAAGAFDGPDGLMHWARAVLVLMLWGIGVAILSVILFTVGHRILTGEKPDGEVVDERDRQIRLRGMQVNLIVTSFGFLLLVVLLALGRPVIAGLNLMLAFCILSDLAGNLTRIVLYRRGS